MQGGPVHARTVLLRRRQVLRQRVQPLVPVRRRSRHVVRRRFVLSGHQAMLLFPDPGNRQVRAGAHVTDQIQIFGSRQQQMHQSGRDAAHAAASHHDGHHQLHITLRTQ